MNPRYSYLILTTLFVFLLTAFSKIDDPTQKFAEIGEKLPDYTFTSLINSSEQVLKLSTIKDKAIILEFWSTSCAPCISALDKLNKIQKKYKEDLLVITISLDDSLKLARFLDKRNINLITAADKNHRDVFPYRIIPHTILIDKQAYVRAITSPRYVDEAVVVDLIKGEKIELPFKDEWDPKYKEQNRKLISSYHTKSADLSLYAYEEGKPSLSSRGNEGYFWMKKNKFIYQNVSLVTIYQDLCSLASTNRVQFEDQLSLDDFHYDNKDNIFTLEAKGSISHDSLNTLAKAFINSVSNFNFEQKLIPSHVYLLKKTEKLNIQQSHNEKEEKEFRGPFYSQKNLPIKPFSEYLENFTNLAVLDSTALDGLYNIQFEWSFADSKSFYSAIDSLGLSLKKDTTKLYLIDGLVVKKEIKGIEDIQP